MRANNILSAILLFASTASPAQDGNGATISSPELSGYVIGRYQASLKDGDNSNSFEIRMARLSLSGHIFGDFEYRVQGQVNGNTETLGSSPRLIDAFAEWQKYGFFKVKAGQFKRPFTFENPMNPIDQGFMGNAQAVSKLSGSNDRTGEHASNGRDIGIQIQGDLLPDASGRCLLHYQAGVFNGQGINTKDADNRKDLIVGAWVMPIAGMRVGVFGWAGSHARKGTWLETEDGNTIERHGTVSLSQYRYALSAEYRQADWQIRSEYIHSTGYGFKTAYQNDEDKNDATVNYAQGNKADGFYALCIAPVIKGKLKVKARYDLYRRSGSWTDSRTQYEAGLNFLVNKNIEIQAEYAFINDRSLDRHNYDIADIELCVKF
ncbi:porin [Prevotella sp. MGM1]|uniref:porin n=1 Tax=Prevotella sp. MGM1 TaxID=2033405 RepID=UPI000CE9B019|nr:porin [Prevotella sp. MGM1]